MYDNIDATLSALWAPLKHLYNLYKFIYYVWLCDIIQRFEIVWLVQ